MPYRNDKPSAWVLPLKFDGGGYRAGGRAMFDSERNLWVDETSPSVGKGSTVVARPRHQVRGECSHMIRPEPGPVGIPIRLALLPADVPGLYPRGGSRHGTAEGQRRVSRMAEAFRDHGGPQRQHRRPVDLQRHEVSQAGGGFARKGWGLRWAHGTRLAG